MLFYNGKDFRDISLPIKYLIDIRYKNIGFLF